jgi:ribosomal protein S6
MAKNETHTSDNAKLYELGIHILPTIAEDKVTDAFSNVTGIISKNKGVIIKTGEPKAIKLAYTITKKINTKNERFKTAYFGWIKFEADSKAIENIKIEVKADKDILRYIIVKTVDDDEHSTIKLVGEEDTKDGLENADESEMDSEEVIDTSMDSEEEGLLENQDNNDEVSFAEIDTSNGKEETLEKEEKKEKESAKVGKKDLDQIDEVIDELSK